MKLQGVIFDLDGVITDTAHLHFQAWQQIAAEIGISIDAQFNESLKGISRDESLRRILQHGGKEGDFNPQERAQLAYRKNLLYVGSFAHQRLMASDVSRRILSWRSNPDERHRRDRPGVMGYQRQSAECASLATDGRPGSRQN